jgi:hypothetical protein
MNDYFSTLVARQLGLAETVRPRLAGRFEPPVAALLPEVPNFAADAGASETKPHEVTFEAQWQARPTTHGGQVSSSPQRNDAYGLPPATPDLPPAALDAPTQVIVKPPREESALVTDRLQDKALFSEPIDAANQAEPLHARTSTRTLRPEVSTTPVRDGSLSEPATFPPPDDNGNERQIPAPADESNAPVRDLRIVPVVVREGRLVTVVPAVPDEPAHAATLLRDSVGTHVEKAESNPPVSPTRNTNLSPTTVRPRTDHLAPSTPESRAQPPASEYIPPVRDDATPSGNTPTHERQDPIKALTVTEPSAALTIAPRISRHVPQRAAAREPAQTSAKAAPTINVTIGRVEVRATHQAQPGGAGRQATTATTMSLEEYLRRRAGGGAG